MKLFYFLFFTLCPFTSAVLTFPTALEFKRPGNDREQLEYHYICNCYCTDTKEGLGLKTRLHPALKKEKQSEYLRVLLYTNNHWYYIIY